MPPAPAAGKRDEHATSSCLRCLQPLRSALASPATPHNNPACAATLLLPQAGLCAMIHLWDAGESAEGQEEACGWYSASVNEKCNCWGATHGRGTALQ